MLWGPRAQPLGLFPPSSCAPWPLTGISTRTVYQAQTTQRLPPCTSQSNAIPTAYAGNSPSRLPSSLISKPFGQTLLLSNHTSGPALPESLLALPPPKHLNCHHPAGHQRDHSSLDSETGCTPVSLLQPRPPQSTAAKEAR